MVATTDRYATDVGVRTLEAGGNAVDAAVAVALALAVVNPEAGNLGGGSFLLLRSADGTLAALDGRSRAPAAATPDMFVRTASGHDGASVLGHLAVAVPGTVRSLHEAHVRLGRAPWASLVQPAVELARGFVVTPRLVASYEHHIVDGLARYRASADTFLPGGAPPEVGATFHQPELAAVLERIRDRGADGFYRGETAAAIEAEMGRSGGIVTAADLAGYEAVWRVPVRSRYRGHTLVSMPPPSSGGPTLGLIAGVLAHFDLADMAWHEMDHLHHLAEAWKRAFADRNHLLADPDFVPVPMESLASATYRAQQAAGIRPDRATPSSEVLPGVAAPKGDGATTHFSVVDGEGGAASVTTTLNTWYGSKVVAEGTGVLLNNEMDDFSTRPGEPNFFGLVQGEANAVAPGKRPLSAMTPTLVLDGQGELRMAIGSPGGATIITTVFQVLSNVLDHGMALGDAVRAPRAHHQHVPDRLLYEPGGLPPGTVGKLEALGHEVAEHDEMKGDVQAVLVRPDGVLEGSSDPRRGGAARGL